MKKFLNKLKRYIVLPLIEQDKANHFIYGIIIYFIFKLIFSMIFGLTTGILVGSIFGIVAAIGKEIYDNKHPHHTSDWKDAAYTIAGVILGIIITVL